MAEVPLFVKIERYKEINKLVNEIKDKLALAREILKKIQDNR